MVFLKEIPTNLRSKACLLVRLSMNVRSWFEYNESCRDEARGYCETEFERILFRIFIGSFWLVVFESKVVKGWKHLTSYPSSSPQPCPRIISLD